MLVLNQEFCRMILDMDEPKKKKRIGLRLLPLWIILTLLVILIVPPIALVAFAYDGRTNTTQYKETTMEEVGSRAFIRGLNNISDNGILGVSITKNDINGIIVHILKENSNIQGIENIYILTHGEEATVYLEAAFQKYRTRFSIKTSLNTIDEYFIMNIKEFKLGSIALTKDMALKIFNALHIDVSKKMDMDKFTLDFENWQITLSKDLMFSSLESGSGQNDFIAKAFKMIEDNQLIAFDTSSDNLIDMNVNLGKLHNSEYLTNDDDHLFINKPSSIYANTGVDEIKAEIGGKLNKLLPYLNANNINSVFQFLFRGYDYCDEQTKNVIVNLDNQHAEAFLSAGIPDVTTYTAYMAKLQRESGNIMGNAKAQVNYASIDSQKTCLLYEKDINSYFRSLGLIGYSIVVYHESDDGLEYAYILVDNFYCNIIDNTLYFTVGLNMNGYETNLVLRLDQHSVSTEPSKIYFKISNIYFGEVDATELLDTIVDLLKTNVAGNDTFGFVSDSEYTYFFFDKTEIVEKIQEFDPTITMDDVQLFARGENIQDEGCFSIEIN